MNEENTRRSILLIDDDKFLLDMYSMKFIQQGYKVQACLSVADALQVLRGGYDPEAIVFDLVMPERDGFSFLQTVHDEHLVPHAVKIALSNQSDDAEKAKELGADSYIVKASMIPSEVVNTVSEQIQTRKKA